MSIDDPVVASPAIRQSRRGGTGHQTWNSAHILAGVLLAADARESEAEELPVPLEENRNGVSKREKRRQRCILELGSGTGQLAVKLAQAGWRGILATDGDPAVVRNMKYNVQANRLGHAVRCLKWDWEESPPKGLELANVDLVIGSDLVYYNRAHGMLASVLYSILTSRPRGGVRPPARALLLCCLRQAYDDGAGQVSHHLSSDGYDGSSMQRFIEGELPSHALIAYDMPISTSVFDGMDDESVCDALASTSARSSYRLYEVVLDTREKQVPVPQVQTVEKVVEVPHTQFFETVVPVPQVVAEEDLKQIPVSMAVEFTSQAIGRMDQLHGHFIFVLDIEERCATIGVVD